MDEFFFEDKAFDELIKKEEWSAYDLYVESIENVFATGYYDKRTQEGMKVRIKDFFSRLILGIKRFVNELREKIGAAVREKQIKKKMQDLRVQLLATDYTGQKTVKIPDYKEFYKKLQEYNNDLEDRIDNFCKKEWNSTDELDSAIEEYEELINKYSVALDDILIVKKEFATTEAINFVERELSGGGSECLKYMEREMKKFEKIQSELSDIKVRRVVMGEDIIPKKINVVQRASLGASKFLKKKVSKYIAGTVFIFG